MACTPQDLAADSRCLAAALSDHQLLASIAYQLAVAGGVDPTPAVLIAQGKCLVAAMSETQLLAAIAALQCALAP